MQLYSDDTRPYVGWDDQIKSIVDAVPEMRQVFPAEPPSMNDVRYAKQAGSGAGRINTRELFGGSLPNNGLPYTDTKRKHARNVTREGDFFYSYDMLIARVYRDAGLTLFAKPPTPTTAQHQGAVYRGAQSHGIIATFDSIDEPITTQDVVRAALMDWHKVLTRACRATKYPQYDMRYALALANELRGWLQEHGLTYHVPTAREMLSEKQWAKLVGRARKSPEHAGALRELGGE